jgi:hypothetical protein
VSRAVKPISKVQEIELERALDDLKAARGRLIFAGSLRAAARVASAIKSTEGALRHVWAREHRGRVDDIEQAHREATMEAWAREMTPPRVVGGGGPLGGRTVDSLRVRS